MEGTFICLGIVVIIVPLALLVIGAIELHKLKSAVRHLVRRVGELESRGVIAVTPPPAAASASPTAQPRPSPLTPPPIPPASSARAPAAPPASAPQLNWESIIGVKLFAWIGGLAFFLGVVFFVKYAFDNNFITPAMRIVCGAIVGALLVIGGSLSATRRYRIPAQSLCVTGVLVLYADIYAAHTFYHLVPLFIASLLMSAITIGALLLASRLNVQSVVWLALLGGFLTPALLWTRNNNAVALFGYIAFLNLAVAAVAILKRWDYLVLLAALGTVAAEFGWAAEFFGITTAEAARNIFLGLEAQFLAMAIYRARFQPREDWSALATALAALATISFCIFASDAQEKFRADFAFPILFFANSGLIALAAVRNFPERKFEFSSVALSIALALTWLAEWAWHGAAFESRDPILALSWSIAIFLLFAAAPHFCGTERRWPWVISAVAGALQFWFVYRLILTRFPNNWIFLVPIAFGIPASVNLVYLVRQKGLILASGDGRLAAQSAALLFFISLIFPVQFEREWITLGWAIEGVALLWLFRALPNQWLRVVATIVLAAAFVRLAFNPAVLEYHRRSAIPIWNWYLYAYGVAALCFFLAANLIQHRAGLRLFAALGTLLLFLLLNIEIADYFSIGPTLTFSFSGNFARDMTYSIAWALYAFALLLIGMRQKTRWVRYSGVALLVVTLIKLFLHDLGNLSQLYRIGAFIGVAVILIVASFVYQRFLVPADKRAQER